MHLKSLPRWNHKKINLDNFIMSLEWSVATYFSDILNPNPNEYSDWLNSIMNNACEIAVPKITFSNNKKQTYWWSDVIQDKRRTVITTSCAWTRCKRRLDINDPHLGLVYSTYRKAKRDFKRKIKLSKRNVWRELLASLEEDSWSLPYRMVLLKLRSGTCLLETLPKVKLDKLLDNLFPSDITDRTNPAFFRNIDCIRCFCERGINNYGRKRKIR